MAAICIGFKAHMGWVNAVAVKVDADKPDPVIARRIDLVESDDRELSEPYHVAGGWSGSDRVPRPANPAAVIERGLARQRDSARQVLMRLRVELGEEGFEWRRSVLLERRGIVHTLKDTLASHAHIHIAEGDAIRDAVRTSMEAMGIELVGQDEKRILFDACERLPEEPDGLMKACRPAGAISWTKEHRLIGLAAWLHA